MHLIRVSRLHFSRNGCLGQLGRLPIKMKKVGCDMSSVKREFPSRNDLSFKSNENIEIPLEKTYLVCSCLRFAICGIFM